MLKTTEIDYRRLANPKELAIIVSEVSNRSDITIHVVDVKGLLALTDMEEVIVISTKGVPKGATSPDKIRRCFDSLAAHEAGHWILTKENQRGYRNLELRICKTPAQNKLIRAITNIIEDPRVDNWLLRVWKMSFGTSTAYYNRMFRKYQEQNAKDKSDGDRLNKALAVIIAKGCYGSKIPVEEFFAKGPQPQQETRKVQKAITKSLRIIKRVKYERMVRGFVNAAEEMYHLLEPFMPNENRGHNGKMIPVKQGGEFQPDMAQGDIDLEDAKPDPDAEDGMPPPPGGFDSKRSGKTTGAEFPAPDPNYNEYLRLSSQVASMVRSLLERLKKRSQVTRAIRRPWQSRGRLMMEAWSIIEGLTQSGQPILSVYERRDSVVAEAERPTIGVIVDVSGSMDIDESKRALTLLSDVAGKWLKDEEFALLIFGAGYQKIKTFFERYDLTRGRIGGIDGRLSSDTDLLSALKPMHTLMNAVKAKVKIVIIVSDFATRNHSESIMKIDMMEKDNIRTIAVGMGHGNLIKTRQFSGHATYIPSIVEFPKLFADLYNQLI